MKKIIAGIVFLLCIGGILYQNAGRVILTYLSERKLINPFQASTTASTSFSPPYKNGAYTGIVANAFYGNIQVKVTVQGGKITDINFLQYPDNQMHSVVVNILAIQSLKQEAIQSQGSIVDIVTGATSTSGAFMQSLKSALLQSKKV